MTKKIVVFYMLGFRINVVSFSDHQRNALFELFHKSTHKTKQDVAVLSRIAGTGDRKIHIKDISLLVPLVIREFSKKIH